MKNKRLAALALAAALLSGCGAVKQKAAEYYLGQARKTAATQNAAPEDIEAAFASVDKALGYAPGSEQAVALLEDLANSAAKSGFARGQELQTASLKKALTRAPLNWYAREALINLYGASGDMGGLGSMAAQAREIASSAGPSNRYCALLAALAAEAAAVPWLENEGYLAMNKSPEVLFERTAAYSAAVAKLPALEAELARLSASDPGLKRAAPAALVSAAEVSAADALRSPDAVRRATEFTARAGSDPAFRKAVEMTVRGNAHLVNKEYSQARTFYQGALNYFPGLLDARRQMAEADFQEGAALAAAGENRKTASQLLYKAYGGAGAVIAAALKDGNALPFIKPERFLGEVYALKAADLAALSAVEGARLRKTAKLEAEFKAALDEAVKLNPEGRLARELLERYSREGF